MAQQQFVGRVLATEEFFADRMGLDDVDLQTACWSRSDATLTLTITRNAHPVTVPWNQIQHFFPTPPPSPPARVFPLPEKGVLAFQFEAEAQGAYTPHKAGSDWIVVGYLRSAGFGTR